MGEVVRISNEKSSLEIGLAALDGDVYITVQVNSHGFKASNDLHVFASDFRQFCTDLIELHRTLKGKAILKGVSPDELEILVHPSGSLGHLEVSGKTGYHVLDAQDAFWHEIKFGFQIEPNALDSAVKVGWVLDAQRG